VEVRSREHPQRVGTEGQRRFDVAEVVLGPGETHIRARAPDLVGRLACRLESRFLARGLLVRECVAVGEPQPDLGREFGLEGPFQVKGLLEPCDGLGGLVRRAERLRRGQERFVTG
jgi:hypothetical protein